MIIDSFIFYNEFDMLEYRLNVLYEHIDYFIIVESSKTFVGNNKILYFNDNKDRYSNYLDKIIHIIVDDMPETDNPWIREYHQRNCIDRGIQQLSLKDNDLIIISDVDEIPNINTIKSITNMDSLISLEQDNYYYNLNYRFDAIKICASKCMYYNIYVNKYNRLPQNIRNTYINIIKNGGWHLSCFGDEFFIQNKLLNFSHQEFNNDEYINIDKIKERMLNGIDIVTRKNIISEFIKISDNKNLPPKHELLLKWFNAV